jgi:hypothetical protein
MAHEVLPLPFVPHLLDIPATRHYPAAPAVSRHSMTDTVPASNLTGGSTKLQGEDM